MWWVPARSLIKRMMSVFPGGLMTPLWSLQSARSSSYCTSHDTGTRLINIRKSPTAANLASLSELASCDVHKPCEHTWAQFQANRRSLVFDLRHLALQKNVATEIIEVLPVKPNAHQLRNRMLKLVQCLSGLNKPINIPCYHSYARIDIKNLINIVKLHLGTGISGWYHSCKFSQLSHWLLKKNF